MQWDKVLPVLFDGSGAFALHPADEKRAFEWLADLRARGIGWKEAERQLRDYMASKDWSPEHIDRQIGRARDRMRLWMLD